MTSVARLMPSASDSVVKFGLGDRIVDIDRREGQFAGFLKLIQPMHTGGGFLGNALEIFGNLCPAGGVFGIARGQPIHNHQKFFIVVGLIQQ
jgi:hypothetical protein